MYIPGNNAFPLPGAGAYDPSNQLASSSPFITFKGGKHGGSHHNHHHQNSESEKWSSLIGVVTAICGNVLISFALNTQRYAHMRLSRDKEEREEEEKKRERVSNGQKKNNDSGRSASGKTNTSSAGYGTQEQQQQRQEDVADDWARLNAQAGADGQEDEEYTLLGDGGETTPLIPRAEEARKRVGSASSDETAKADGGERNGETKEKSYLRSPIWWMGIALMVVGEAGNFLAYGFAPASLVSPLGVVALVSNCLIAPWLLHERFRWRDALGVIIAVAGCVTVVLSANDSNPKLTQDRIWTLISQWEFETYFGITVFLIIVLAVASNRFGHRSVLIDLGLVALFGGYTALSTKGVASLLSNKIWRIITFPITYLLVVVLVFTAVMQIKYLNRALQRFNATVVIPTQFVLFTISVIVGSAILYRDFERTTSQDAAEFLGGCALTFLGVWCITSGRSRTGDDGDDGADDDEEEGVDLVDEEGVQPEIRERDDDTARRMSSIAGSSYTGTGLQGRQPSDAMFAAASTSGSLVDESPLSSLKPPRDLMPANASAIHSTYLPTEADGIDTAYQQNAPPPMHTTTSEPVVPTLASERPHTPLRSEASAPYSHANQDSQRQQQYQQQSDHHRLPETFLTPPRQRLLARQSMTGLFPAPYTSPLSNSLSAIVADSLRRGPSESSPNTAFLRRRRILARSKSGRSASRPYADDAAVPGTAGPSSAAFLSPADAVRPKRHSIASGDMPFEEVGNLRAAAVGAGETGEGGGSWGRMRSMSATISDIFGSGKKARMQSQESLPERD